MGSCVGIALELKIGKVGYPTGTRSRCWAGPPIPEAGSCPSVPAPGGWNWGGGTWPPVVWVAVGGQGRRYVWGKPGGLLVADTPPLAAGEWPGPRTSGGEGRCPHWEEAFQLPGSSPVSQLTFQLWGGLLGSALSLGSRVTVSTPCGYPSAATRSPGSLISLALSAIAE